MKTRARRRGGGREKKKNRSVRIPRYSKNQFARRALEEAASIHGLKLKPKKNLTHKARLTVSLFTHNLKKGQTKKSRRRANLQRLIDFLDELDDMDEQALKRSDGEFRDKLIYFVTYMLGEIEEAVDNLKYMLPASDMNEENAGDDLDKLVGAMKAIRIAPAESNPFETIDMIKDLLEKLGKEYRSYNIQEEARAMYGDAIDMIVDAFIEAIRKHAHELKAVAVAAPASAAMGASAAAAPANAPNIDNITMMLGKLGV